MQAPLINRVARLLGWLLKGVLFLLLLGLAVKNSEPVVLRYYFGFEWHAPMALLLFTFFVGGALLGLLAMLEPWVRQRGEIRRLREAAAHNTPDRIDHA